MSLSLTFYFPFSPNDLETIIESFRKEFDELLKDSFADSELEVFEAKLDALGAVYVQPVMDELSFHDFYPDPEKSDEQESFFKKAKSSLCIENLPYLETNPFQVSYLRMLAGKFSNFLVDRGGVHELLFKEDFLKLLESLKSMDKLLLSPPVEETKRSGKNFYPVDPLDFIFVDVIKEFEKLRSSGKEIDASTLGEAPKKILNALLKSDFDHPIELFKASGLGAKAFDDGLERLKFFLRSL